MFKTEDLAAKTGSCFTAENAERAEINSIKIRNTNVIWAICCRVYLLL